MTWVILLVVVLIAAFAIPRLGKALLVGLGVLLVLVAVGAIAVYVIDRQQKAEREVAKTRIKPSEVELVDLLLRPGYGHSSYTLVGRIRNRSARYTLTELRLKLTMHDCSAATKMPVIDEEVAAAISALSTEQRAQLETALEAGADCEIVGQADEVLYISAPPGQARDIDEYVSFLSLRQPRGKHQWGYTITELLGR